MQVAARYPSERQYPELRYPMHSIISNILKVQCTKNMLTDPSYRARTAIRPRPTAATPAMEVVFKLAAPLLLLVVPVVCELGLEVPLAEVPEPVAEAAGETVVVG